MTGLKSYANWELMGKLGQGGFGEVLHWRNKSTGLDIATKRIKDVTSLSADEQQKLIQRWQLEHKWTLELTDVANIVSGVSLEGEQNAQFIEYLNRHHIHPLPVIVLEFCNGGDVRERLKLPEHANGLLEFEVREILRALRMAIHYLHAHCKIYHRDLKPDNIVIQCAANGRKVYKLTDFGLARRAPEHTMLQSVVGTRHYFAPEVVDSGKYNTKIDYWSLGVIAYELCCGVLPFIQHQTLINIITTIRKKTRNCIAISEDPGTADRFLFHNELPQTQHLSAIWAPKLTKWLRSALEVDPKMRGVFDAAVATDEVQTPAIFVELDQLLDCKVLTLFAVFNYKRLAYEITPDLATMSDLRELICLDTDIPKHSIYFVLPAGHPLKGWTEQTRPIDLFVANWQDTSKEARYPPVMAYVFDTRSKGDLNPPEASATELLKHAMEQTPQTRKPWLNERLVLDMHFVLSEEQLCSEMLLLGLKEFAMSLEDDLLNCSQYIANLGLLRQKVYGAIDHFKSLLFAGQEQLGHLLNNADTLADWNTTWFKVCCNFDGVVKSIDGIVKHYESTLRNIREALKSISKQMNQDTFKVAEFRQQFLVASSGINYEDFPNNTLITYAKRRNKFFNNATVKKLCENIMTSYQRRVFIPTAVKNATLSLHVIEKELVQLHLQLWKNAATALTAQSLTRSLQQLYMHKEAPDGGDQLNGLNGLRAFNVINEALRTNELLENDMYMSGGHEDLSEKHILLSDIS